jgi:hypothetical protein
VKVGAKMRIHEQRARIYSRHSDRLPQDSDDPIRFIYGQPFTGRDQSAKARTVIGSA